MASGQEIAAKLDEARALIERGWCQGEFRQGDRFCLYGAVNQAVLADAEADTSFTALHEEFLGKVIGRDPWELASWNDAPERTQAEVIEAFRKAAELAREQQS